MEEQSHATRAEVAVAVDVTGGRVYLRIRPQVTDALNVDHYQLVARPLEREMTECL